MTTRRKLLIALGWCSITAPLASFAQRQPAKRVRIGMAISGSASSHKSQIDAFRDGLRELGYVEGKDVVLEYRYADGMPARHSDLVGELVRSKPDIIIVSSTSLVAAAKRATSTIPIVVASAGDLVGTGIVPSLAKPGGNVTGTTGMAPELSGKRLEVLREVVPHVSRIAVIWYPTRGGSDELEVRQTETAARQFGIQVQVVEVRDPNEFQSAYAAMIKQRANAVIFIQGTFTRFHNKQLSDLAAINRLPSICEQAFWAESGCLISYGTADLLCWRRAAIFVDKILKGAKPGDLPVEQPTKFELVVNMKTAKALGITIPQSILVRADRVIE